MTTTTVQPIETQAQLRSLARRLGVRSNWHEPDEQGISARIVGTRLDNAYGSETTPQVTSSGQEINVVLTQEDAEGHTQDVAVVNLATLLAFAAGTYHG